MKKILFLAVVCMACLTAKAQKADTTIVFTKTVHNFGDITQSGGTQTVRFEFTNTGDTPIVISGVAPSCGCTTSGWTKEPVKSGEKGYVEATYNPTSAVPFDKTLTVNTNAAPSTIVLHIKGNVVDK